MDYNRIGEGNELSGFIKNACGKESLAISGTLAGWRIKVDFRKKILETGGAITMGNFSSAWVFLTVHPFRVSVLWQTQHIFFTAFLRKSVVVSNNLIGKTEENFNLTQTHSDKGGSNQKSPAKRRGSL
jgi:hypothetical protein